MGKLVSKRLMLALPPSIPAPANESLPRTSPPKWLGGGSVEDGKGSVDVRTGGGDLGIGDREDERRDGGERARSCSGAVS